MTPADIVAEARDRLNHASAVVITDQKMDRAFNAACERWAMDTLSLERILNLDVLQGQQDYDRSLFPDLYELDRVTILDVEMGPERLLLYIPEDELPIRYRQDTGGPPCAYSFRGDGTLVLWPKPSVTILGGLALYAKVLPPTFTGTPTSTSTLPFPRTHREGLVRALCLLLCELNLEDHTLAARLPLALEAYTTEMERVAAHAGQPNTTLIMGRRTRRPARLAIAPFNPLTGERFNVRGP